MALKLKKTVNGYDFDYWRIDRVLTLEPKRKIVSIRLGLYKDADYAHGDTAKPVQHKDITYSGTNYPVDIDVLNQADNNIYKVLYGQIKQPVIESQLIQIGDVLEQQETNTNEFTEAEDC